MGIALNQIRVAENSSLHWHAQKDTTASLGPPPHSSIVTTAHPSPTQTPFTNANTTHKCTLNIFWNPVTIFLPVQDKKGLNSNTKIHIFETGSKQKLNIIKANLHIQKKICTL